MAPRLSLYWVCSCWGRVKEEGLGFLFSDAQELDDVQVDCVELGRA